MAGGFFLLRTSVSSKPVSDLHQNVVCVPPPTVKRVDNATTTEFAEWLAYHDPNEWLTYHDQKYHYRIDYPCWLSVHNEDGNIAFILPSEADGPGQGGGSVVVEPTSFTTPEEWIAQKNKKIDAEFTNREYPIDKSLIPYWGIDGTITLNGHTGIVAHGTSDGYPLPPVVLFIKGGNLFSISDRSVDYQRTWASFHVEE
jgi:hypothetical protein